MSLMLYVMRHGIAEEGSRDLSDADRALTDEGIRKTTQVADGLKALGLRIDAVISSPLRRAAETARIVGNVLVPDAEVELTPVLAAGSAAERIAGGLRPPKRAAAILLVGHQPDLGELASYLLTGSAHTAPLPFKKAGVAAIEVDGLPPKTTGLLHWFATPALLRAVGQK
jgi:phosphohistidine phosphatase